jgi:hypothetical protein
MRDMQHPASVDFTARLSESFRAHPLHDDVLKEAVCVYVDQMKRAGLSVEQIIIELKRAAATRSDPAFRALRGRGSDPTEETAILNRAVSWCIERYFEGTQPT